MNSVMTKLLSWMTPVRKSQGIGAMLFSALMIVTASARAELSLEQVGINLGEVRAGIRLRREVALLNHGEMAVEILEVRGSCGCVAPRVEPKTLPPQARGVLHLSINTLGEGAGPHAWKVAIRYRQGEHVNELELPMRAHIITEITVQPASMTLVTEGGLTQTVVVTDLRSRPLKITGVATTAEFLKARLVDQGIDACKCWSAKITLEIARELPAGRRVEALAIYTDDPLYGELRVPVTVVKPTASAVTVDPPSVHFEPASENVSQMVRIRAPDGKAIEIEKVLPAHEALTCRWAKGTGEDAFVKVQVDPARLNGMCRNRVEVYLSAPVREVITIPVKIGEGERETQAGPGNHRPRFQ